jgi:flagellar protein FlaI
MFEKLTSKIKEELKKPLFNKDKGKAPSTPKEEGKGKEELKFKINFNPPKSDLPDIQDKTKVDFRYAILAPYSYIHLHWDEVHGEIVYNVEEPNLDVKEKEVLNLLEQGIQELIDISFINVDDKEVLIEYLEKNINVLIKELGIDVQRASYLKIMYYIYRDFIGLNKIEALMKDPHIEDIECNGKGTPVYIVHRKFGNIKTNIVYENIDELVSFVEKLAQKCGKYVSYANPIMDGRLPAGDRVNATYTEDVTSKGPTFSIRRFTREAWSPIKLMQVGTVSAEIMAYLWLLVENGSNILIVGGTGSGKTSLVNVLASFIKPEARIVTIEDTRELKLIHENWLPSVARAGAGVGTEKAGEITLFDLLKASFRQRPDYVIVGEIRGKEAFVLFQGMASGHSGISTMHADDVKTVIRRLETEPINLSPSLVETLDIICLMVYAKVGGENARKMKAIQEIISVKEGGESEVNVPFMWDPSRNVFMFKRDSVAFKKIVSKKGGSLEGLNKEFNIRVKLLKKLYQDKIVEFEDVQKIIGDYYKNKMGVLKRLGL